LDLENLVVGVAAAAAAAVVVVVVVAAILAVADTLVDVKHDFVADFASDVAVQCLSC
jgi:hypothetical protein